MIQFPDHIGSLEGCSCALADPSLRKVMYIKSVFGRWYQCYLNSLALCRQELPRWVPNQGQAPTTNSLAIGVLVGYSMWEKEGPYKLIKSFVSALAHAWAVLNFERTNGKYNDFWVWFLKHGVMWVTTRRESSFAKLNSEQSKCKPVWGSCGKTAISRWRANVWIHAFLFRGQFPLRATLTTRRPSRTCSFLTLKPLSPHHPVFIRWVYICPHLPLFRWGNSKRVTPAYIFKIDNADYVIRDSLTLTFKWSLLGPWLPEFLDYPKGTSLIADTAQARRSGWVLDGAHMVHKMTILRQP